MAFEHRNYREFNFSHPDTDLTHEEIVDRREVVYVPTGYETEIGMPQYLAVARMLPEGDAPEGAPIIEFPAFTDETAVRKDSSAPFRLAHANALNRAIYTVQAPGVHTWWLRDAPKDTTHRRTREQRRGLIENGSFEHIGRACLAAVRAADEYFNGGIRRDEEVYDFHGSSMGAAIAIGALSSYIKDDDRSFRVNGVALSEIVNVRPYSYNQLAYFAKFSKLDTEYVNCNPPSVLDAEEPQHMWLRRALSSPAANFGPRGGYGAALAHGDEHAFGNIAALSPSQLDIPVVTAWGAESALTSEEGRLWVERKLQLAKATMTSIVHEGHDHGYTLTAESVKQEIEALEVLQGLRAA